MCTELPGPDPVAGVTGSVVPLWTVAEGQYGSGHKTLLSGTPGPGPVCELHNGLRESLLDRERPPGGRL